MLGHYESNVHLSKNPMFYDRTKHINVKCWLWCQITSWDNDDKVKAQKTIIY